MKFLPLFFGLFAPIRRYWQASIRRQMVLGFGATTFALMLISGYLLYAQQRHQLYLESMERASTLAHALSISSTSWVLADDVVGLNEVVSGLSGTIDLQRAFLLSPDGEVLASTMPDEINQFVIDPVSRGLLKADPRQHILVDQPNIIDVAVPVMAGARHVGWARIELTRDSVHARLRQLTIIWLGFAVFSVAFLALLAQKLARGMATGLYQLTGVVGEIQAGHYQTSASELREDELGLLARGINAMRDGLQFRERQRDEAEALLARSRTELQRFAEISAHHLQEPARRIASYAERLTAQLAGRLDDAQANLSLEYIGQQARRQQNLLHDIERYLAASQPRGELKDIDTQRAVVEILEKMAERVSEAGAEITLNDLPVAHIDAPRLKDLFTVALDNALNFGRSERPLHIIIAGERQGDCVRYSISDNGPGVEAEYRERVFRVFERLAAASEGTGIGLAILRRVAESTGGRAWIEETPGGGCRVLFELPAGEHS